MMERALIFVSSFLVIVRAKLQESEALLPEAVHAQVLLLYDLARGCGGEPASLHLEAR